MYVISPSVSLRLTPSSSEEGKEYEPRFWLHLMVRTEDPAAQGFGSAVLESVGFAPAGRGLQAAVPRLNL